jgi:polyferredoxin
MALKTSLENRGKGRRSLWRGAVLVFFVSPILLASGITKIVHFSAVRDPIQLLFGVLDCVAAVICLYLGISLMRSLRTTSEG